MLAAGSPTPVVLVVPSPGNLPALDNLHDPPILLPTLSNQFQHRKMMI